MKEIGTFIWKKGSYANEISIFFCDTRGDFRYRVIRRNGRKRLRITWKLLEDDEERWEAEPDTDFDCLASKFREIGKDRLVTGETIFPEHYKNRKWRGRGRDR